MENHREKILESCSKSYRSKRNYFYSNCKSSNVRRIKTFGKCF